MTIVNDIHSQLNPTRVAAVVRPRSVDEVRAAISTAAAGSLAIGIAGGFHAMGGQQFAAGGVLLDMRSLNRVVGLDDARGILTVEAGIQWPELIIGLEQLQSGRDHRWGIIQKQTGADRLSLGGALSCNAHGRGLTLPPIVGQVDGFTVIDHRGDLRRCSRHEHPELFALAIGGYGLFGVITDVSLRLQPRTKVRRLVTLEDADDVMARFDDRIRDGCAYGDFQFAIDASSDAFLRRGVFSCYQRVDDATPATDTRVRFSPEVWERLIRLAHTNKSLAFGMYSTKYQLTSGQVYWSDDQLASSYVDGYHYALDRACGAVHRGSEMITELYVPRPRLAAFLRDARAELRIRRANVIYGTVRLIERDEETFLAWAPQPWACIVINLHIDHVPDAIARAAETFRALIDVAIVHGGSFYLTYHRWARRDQIETCYPQFEAFLAAKLAHDPEERFQSNWYRHNHALFNRTRQDAARERAQQASPRERSGVRVPAGERVGGSAGAKPPGS